MTEQRLLIAGSRKRALMHVFGYRPYKAGLTLIERVSIRDAGNKINTLRNI